MAVSPNSEWLAVGCADGIIHLLSIPSILASGIEESLKISFAQHSLPISDLRFSLTSGRLYSCSMDQTCKIWAIWDKLLLVSVSFPTILNSLAISPNEDCIYVGGCDGNIYKIDTWEIKGNDINIMSQIQNLPEQIFKGSSSVNCIDTNIDGSILIAGYEDGSIKVWSASSCQLIQTLPQQYKGNVTSIKVLLRPSSISIHSKFRPTLIPLSNILYIPAEVEVFPVRLSYQKKKRLFSLTLDSENDKVASMEEKIKKLEQVNTDWKRLNNELLLHFQTNYYSQVK